MRRSSPWIAWLPALLLVSSAQAFEWAVGAVYDPAIPSPSEYLGREFAERHSSVDEIFGYARLLAERSERVELIEMGRSVEGDPLLLLLVSDPAHRALLERRPLLLRTLMDPWERSQEERARALDEMLPLSWIACSIHGDEASGSDAGLMLAYHLAADQSEATREILTRSMVAIDPCQNPDGRRRFLAHVRSNRRQQPGADENPEAIEHHQLWPGGRRNHYLFDLNRDWAFLTQPETRHRVQQFLKLRPQVFADLHEMNRESSYFFPPPTDPVNPHVPYELREWWDVFGRANAKAFDARGFDYFVRESFDLFYPGYGDSWPTLQGAIGMTFEQATTRGVMLRDEAGKTLRYRDAVLHHFTAALATCATAARNDRELLESFATYFELAKKDAESDSIREYLIPSEGQRFAGDRLASILSAQGIEVLRTIEDAELDLNDYRSGERERVRLPRGSLRIRSAQSARALMHSLLDKDVPMDEHFLRQEELRKEQGLSDRFYDVTAWSLILAHDLRAYSSARDLDLKSEIWSPSTAPASMPGESSYGYLIPYEDNAALRALCRLLWRGLRVHLAQDSFTRDGRAFPRGSLVIKRADNAEIEDLATLITEISRTSGAEVISLDGAWTDAGPALGSSRMLRLTAPRIAMLSGPGLQPAAVGSLRHLFELRYQIPYTEMLGETVSDATLAGFDVLILPEYGGALPANYEAIDRWMRSGGTLVAIGAAAKQLLEGQLRDLRVQVIGDLEQLENGEQPGDSGDPPLAKGGEQRYIAPDRRPDRTPGAIARLELAAEHPFTVGMPGELAAPVLSDRLFRPAAGVRGVAVYAEDEPRISGFIWPRMEKALAGMSYVIHERVDGGQIVLFAEDVSFRGAWEGLDRLFLHAVLFPPNL